MKYALSQVDHFLSKLKDEVEGFQIQNVSIVIANLRADQAESFASIASNLTKDIEKETATVQMERLLQDAKETKYKVDDTFNNKAGGSPAATNARYRAGIDSPYTIPIHYTPLLSKVIQMQNGGKLPTYLLHVFMPSVTDDDDNLVGVFGAVGPSVMTRDAQTTSVTTHVHKDQLTFLPIHDKNDELEHEEDFNGYYNPCAYHAVNPSDPAKRIDTITRAQLFACLDAASLLFKQRAFHNASDSNRPYHHEEGDVEDLHRWCDLLVNSFLHAREHYVANYPTRKWESDVKSKPAKAFPASMIGAMSDSEFSKYFPLIPKEHKVRELLRKVRSLDVMWGTLTSYTHRLDHGQVQGAWMPLSEAHRCRLLRHYEMFDLKEMVPSNPWLPRSNGQGLSVVFNQSYHTFFSIPGKESVDHDTWLRDECRYHPHRSGNCARFPFSHYGGTPVQADFLRHKVEQPDRNSPYKRLRHAMLVYNRFGITGPMRLGQQYHDTGLLQDMFSFNYRSKLRLTKEQRQLSATNVYISNFLSYARNHCILALASSNNGSEAASQASVVRNLFRLYVDVFPDMSAGVGSEPVPIVMGFHPNAMASRSDRPIVMYAGTLQCLNAKLEKFCSERPIAEPFKLAYLNDAALLFTRIAKAEQRRRNHRSNYLIAQARRHAGFTVEEFYEELVDTLDALVEFLQTTVISMMIQSGMDLSKVSLHLLEPRTVSVTSFPEDTDVVGNDFLGPHTMNILRDLDFDKGQLTRTQLAVLSLLPPHHRIFGTLRYNQTTDSVDLEHIRKRVMQQTAASNEQVWQDTIHRMIAASLSQQYLERNGPIEFGLDESSFKDPAAEAAKIPQRMTTMNRQVTSNPSLNQKYKTLRAMSGEGSVSGKRIVDYNEALQYYRNEVDRNSDSSKGLIGKLDVLTRMRIPAPLKEVLYKEYNDKLQY